MVKCIDRAFTDKFLLECYQEVTTNINWTYTNVSNRYQYPDDAFCDGSERIFGAPLLTRMSKHFFRNNTPNIFIEAFEVLMERYLTESPWELFQVDANLQVFGMNGAAHRDDYHNDSTDKTILFFPHYKWENEWGGEFQILDDKNNVVEEYLPMPGRVLIFDSTIKHRGNGPKVKGVSRISIAYRMRDTNAFL